LASHLLNPVPSQPIRLRKCVEVVPHRASQIELLGFLEQPEFVESFAECRKHRLPGMPLTKDVVSCLVVRGAFGEVVCGVAFAFPVGESAPVSTKCSHGPFSPLVQFLLKGQFFPPTTGPYRQRPCSTGTTVKSMRSAAAERSLVATSAGRSKIVPGLSIPGPVGGSGSCWRRCISRNALTLVQKRGRAVGVRVQRAALLTDPWVGC
jgi:hypothetical protein